MSKHATNSDELTPLPKRKPGHELMWPELDQDHEDTVREKNEIAAEVGADVDMFDDGNLPAEATLAAHRAKYSTRYREELSKVNAALPTGPIDDQLLERVAQLLRGL